MGIAIAIFCCFTFIYKLLEQPAPFANTVGKLTDNYVRAGRPDSSYIKEVAQPYSVFVETTAYNWDAKYYHAIRDSLYSGIDSSHMYRYAFYPFFPMVWKISHTNGHGIVVLNYLFFALAIFILSSIFLKNSKSQLYYFWASLILPTAVIYYIPYTEAVFILTFALAVVGLVKRKYWLYFIAMLCFSMTRPASLILIVAFFAVNTINLFYHRKIWHFIKESFLSTIPIFTAWGAVTLIEYYYSHSWNVYNEACTLWPKNTDLGGPLYDWSIEGFGMTIFAIICFAVPAFVYTVIYGSGALVNRLKEAPVSLFSGNFEFIKKYLFNISMMFITGLSLFHLISDGYMVNGFYRYTLCTPFFYIVLLQLPGKLKNLTPQYKLALVLLTLIVTFLFLLSAPYASAIFRFQYLGLLLLILLGIFLLYEPSLPTVAKIIMLVPLSLLSLVWQTFLFNMYLSNAWIFT